MSVKGLIAAMLAALLAGQALAGAPGTSSAGAGGGTGGTDAPRPGMFGTRSIDETSGRGQPTDCGSVISQGLTRSCGGGINGQLTEPLPSLRNGVDSGGLGLPARTPTSAPGQAPSGGSPP